MPPLRFPTQRNEPTILLAISDTDVIISTVIAQIRSVHVMNIDGPLPYDVLAWINLLKREDGGIETR